MNAPDRFELLVLPEGVEKITIKKDTKIPNAATFMVQLEDHTMGNLIRSQLLKDDRVLFCGYRMPHPLEHSIELKVQTTKELTPQQALSEALHGLIIDLGTVQRQFEDELNRLQRTTERSW